MPSTDFARSRPHLRLLRLALPFAASALCLWLIHDRMGGADLVLSAAWGTGLSPVAWSGALLATGLSFWALGRYDALAHRHFATDVSDRAARRAGTAAIAFSQTVGFGLASGSFARWRLLPSLTPVQAFRVTLFVSITFLAGLSVVLAGSAILVPPEPWMRGAAAAWLAFTVPVLALSVVCPVPVIGPLRFRLPSVPAMGAILGWLFLDTAAASTALWFLIPDGAGPDWLALYPVFLLALGAALLSGAPGGIGPFELTLFMLLPDMDAGALAIAILSFRLVYFAIPAVLGGAVLLRPVSPDEPATAPVRTVPLPAQRPHAEAALAQQECGRVIAGHRATLAILETPQTLTALFGPISGSVENALTLLQGVARAGNRVPCLYKCNARAALAARRSGWQVLRIASEAVLDPTRFSTAGSTKRQLRRKLRQAEAAGLEVSRTNGHLPWAELSRIDAEWQARNGPAKGLTMGRFDPVLLHGQAIWLARRNGTVSAFVTAHATDDEWCLDLMRSDAAAPSGTMHALVAAMITDAAEAGISRLSLAAIPAPRGAVPADNGLVRFKSCFAPRWEPRYIAAPTRAGLALACADLACRIHTPRGAAAPRPGGLPLGLIRDVS